VRPAVCILALLVAGGACSAEPPRTTPAASAAPSGEPAPEASASSVSSDAGADADAGIDAGAPPPPKRTPLAPRVRTLDVPEETKSPLPKVAEWTDVVRRPVVEKSEFECTLQRVREWSRVSCNASNATVALVAGTATGVSVWAAEDHLQLLFPVHRGDRRVFEIVPHAKTVIVQGNYGAFPTEQPGGGPVVLSETWLEGEDAPTLVVQ
jgi:hypothetical protein